MFAVTGTKGQATFVSAIDIDRIDIELAADLARKGNALALRAPGRRGIVLALGRQPCSLAGKGVGDKDMRIALPVGDKRYLAAVGAPGRITVDSPAVRDPLTYATRGADQVDLRIAVLGKGQGNLAPIRRHSSGNVEALLVRQLGFFASVNFLAIKIGVVGPVGGKEDLFATGREIGVEYDRAMIGQSNRSFAIDVHQPEFFIPTQIGDIGDAC